MSRLVERVLVVEDSERLLETLERALRMQFDDVRACRTIADARAALVDGWIPDLVIVDYRLPDGDAREVLDLEELRMPAPLFIAISGEAEPIDTFELAQRGVRAFLPKPITLDELDEAIVRVAATGPSLEPHVRQSVGHRGLQEVTEEVRTVMMDEALARTGGSRRGAARILATSRQLLQYLLRRR